MFVVSTQAKSVTGVELDTELAPGHPAAEAAIVTNESRPELGAEATNSDPLGELDTSKDALGKGADGGPPVRASGNEGPVTVKAFCASTVQANPRISAASTYDDARLEGIIPLV
jgi:hypothetical protein